MNFIKEYLVGISISSDRIFCWEHSKIRSYYNLYTSTWSHLSMDHEYKVGKLSDIDVNIFESVIGLELVIGIRL